MRPVVGVTAWATVLRQPPSDFRYQTAAGNYLQALGPQAGPAADSGRQRSRWWRGPARPRRRPGADRRRRHRSRSVRRCPPAADRRWTPRRDPVEFALVRLARQQDLPVLAVYRGIQLVNVRWAARSSRTCRPATRPAPAPALETWDGPLIGPAGARITAARLARRRDRRSTPCAIRPSAAGTRAGVRPAARRRRHRGGQCDGAGSWSPCGRRPEMLGPAPRQRRPFRAARRRRAGVPIGARGEGASQPGARQLRGSARTNTDRHQSISTRRLTTTGPAPLRCRAAAQADRPRRHRPARTASLSRPR